MESLNNKYHCHLFKCIVADDISCTCSVISCSQWWSHINSEHRRLKKYIYIGEYTVNRSVVSLVFRWQTFHVLNLSTIFSSRYVLYVTLCPLRHVMSFTSRYVLYVTLSFTSRYVLYVTLCPLRHVVISGQNYLICK